MDLTYTYFSGICVHEIQFLCGHSTVIYTSITILHSWFCKVWYQKRTNAARPFTRCGLVCFAVETICDRHAEIPRSVGQCTVVFQKILQRKRVDTRDAAIYSWSEFAHLFVWSWHVVIPDLIGRRCILFPYTLSTGDVQQISVHGLVVICSFTIIPVPERLLFNIVVRCVHVAFLQRM